MTSRISRRSRFGGLGLLLALTGLTACVGGSGGGGAAMIATAPASAPPAAAPAPAPAPAPSPAPDEFPALPATSVAFTSFAQPLPDAVTISGTGWSTLASDYFDFGARRWSAAQESGVTLTLAATPARAWVQTPTRLVSINPRDGALVYPASGPVSLNYYAYPYSVMDGTKGVTFANSAMMGFSYQTFGWWWARDDSTGTAAFAFGGLSVGAATPMSAVPAAGSANFNGQVAATYIGRSDTGYYRVDDLWAPMSLAVDFAGRSAAFSSSDLSNGVSGLNGSALSGRLTYGQQNVLTGSLTSANGQFAGPVSGKFYGPAAQEVGGSFVLAPTDGSQIDRLIGGFGAKR